MTRKERKRKWRDYRAGPGRRAVPHTADRYELPSKQILVPREFDELTDEEIEALEASVGASGARRPPSE